LYDADERTSGQDSATGPGAANCNARAAELPGSCFNARVDHVKRQAAVGAERDRDLVLCLIQVGQEQIPVLVEFDRDGRNIGSVCRPAARNCASLSHWSEALHRRPRCRCSSAGQRPRHARRGQAPAAPSWSGIAGDPAGATMPRSRRCGLSAVAPRCHARAGSLDSPPSQHRPRRVARASHTWAARLGDL